MADGKHTIILVQEGADRACRTFMDYETVSKAMDGVCGMFERKLKQLNPNMRDITYDVTDLYNYIDMLVDLTALVYEPNMNAYLPYNKEWIKKRAYTHLRRQAA